MTTKRHLGTESKFTEQAPRPTTQHGAHPERESFSPEIQQTIFFKETIANLREELRSRDHIIGTLENDKTELIVTLAYEAVNRHRHDTDYALVTAENTRLKEENATLKKYAYVDERTGLEKAEIFNNIGFPRAFGTAMRHNLDLVMVLIDLNNLKKTNDTQGYTAGNELLAHTGRVIKDTIRNEDSRYLLGEGYRWGGDEFVILANLPKGKPEEVHSRAKALISRLEKAMASNNVEAAIGACVMVQHNGIPKQEDEEARIAYVEKPHVTPTHPEIPGVEVAIIRDTMFKSAEKEMKIDKGNKKGEPIVDAKRE